ncbi:undecaprenyl-diphosphatase [Salegentibacter echinorum]|uniref:Undecaprenyl-diphosphatase n=1 Tax=Salegentibacter echinorum TaxID=1073325 RepID=A0A1M5FPH5_SALEC|nr:phosphatase PAP2 family protein [Salegentibacter echinorum]SHF93071.1 undecaprenyl-diphosphatase [Salegentibacter echinorum]
MRKTLITILKELKRILSVYLEKYDQKLPYIITCIIALIIFIGGFNLFIELTEHLKSETLATYDSRISDLVVNYRSPGWTKYFVFVTNVGDTWGYAIVFTLCSLLFYWIFKSWKYFLQICLVMVLALGSNILLKKIINRARPEAEHLVSVETLSYPSGHAMTAMAFYGFLIYLVTQFPLRKTLKSLIIAVLVLLILSIGISRIYLGVHFPSDIAGGYIAGLIWVVFCIIIFNLMTIFKRDPTI